MKKCNNNDTVPNANVHFVMDANIHANEGTSSTIFETVHCIMNGNVIISVTSNMNSNVGICDHDHAHTHANANF